jgi:HK97 family phage major capsid protein
MSRLNALRVKLGANIDAREALLKKAEQENRDLSETEDQAFKDLEGDFAKIEDAIKREEQVEAHKAAAAKPLDLPGTQQPAKAGSKARVRYGKMKSFKNDDAGIEAAYRSGQFLLATMMGNEKAAEWCRENGIQITKAQSESVNSAGGFLVPVEFNQAIIDLREEFGTFRQNCQVVPMGSDSMTMPRRAGGLTAYFVGEGVAATESSKQWDQVALSAKKMAVLAKMSTELAEDAVISIADDLAAEMAYAFAVKEDACGWNGDGTSSYGGIVGVRTKIIDGTHTKSAIDGATGHDTFAEIDATDLANVMAALPKYAERNAKWYCSSVAWALVFQRLIQAAGGVTMGELTGGKPTRSYLGYPVVLDQTLPTATTDISDTAMLFFGDLRLAATMGERRGVTIKSSEHRYIDQDQIGIFGNERVDINIHDLGDNTNAGPLIALIGE